VGGYSGPYASTSSNLRRACTCVEATHAALRELAGDDGSVRMLLAAYARGIIDAPRGYPRHRDDANDLP
jgi:hypothetical protein